MARRVGPELPSLAEKKRHLRKGAITDQEDLNKEEEDQREIDQRERRAFEDRLRQKDEAATRNIVPKGLSQQDVLEVQKRKAAAALDDKDEQRAVINMLREKSRQVYLKEREPKKFRELQEQIEDEQFLFSEQKLSRVEDATRTLNETIYRATREARY